MLKQRVVTALMLLALVLPALFHSDTRWFAGLTLLFIVAGGWEWARLNGFATGIALSVGFLLGVALAVFWFWGGLAQPWPLLWWLVGGAWLVLVPWLLWNGLSNWAGWSRWLRLGVGLLLLAAAWVALVQARHLGLVFLLSALALVWVADIAAYFGGRALGRRKLAPSISPGKSWEGVYSGAVGVALLAATWIGIEWSGMSSQMSLYGLLWQRGPVITVLAIGVLVALSVCGDLVESMVKRSAGVKDSSGLLPGHGGVLDRVDALLPVLPMVMFFATLS